MRGCCGRRRMRGCVGESEARSTRIASSGSGGANSKAASTAALHAMRDQQKHDAASSRELRGGGARGSRRGSSGRVQRQEGLRGRGCACGYASCLNNGRVRGGPNSFRVPEASSQAARGWGGPLPPLPQPGCNASFPQQTGRTGNCRPQRRRTASRQGRPLDEVSTAGYWGRNDNWPLS